MTTPRLKEYRERLKISKQKLSLMTGISPSNIWHIETGRVFPYPGWRKRISRALNIPENELFPDCEKKEGV